MPALHVCHCLKARKKRIIACITSASAISTAPIFVQSEAVIEQTKLLKQKYLNKSDPLSLSKIDSERANGHHMTRHFSYPWAKNHRGLQISYRPPLGPALSFEPLILVLLPQQSFCSQDCPTSINPSCSCLCGWACPSRQCLPILAPGNHRAITALQSQSSDQSVSVHLVHGLVFIFSPVERHELPIIPVLLIPLSS